MSRLELNEYINILEKSLEEYVNEFYNYDSEILKAVKYSLLNGGKRTRAILVFLTGELLDIKINKLIPIASAVEMVHCYSLFTLHG